MKRQPRSDAPSPVLADLLEKVAYGFSPGTSSIGRTMREVFERDREGFDAAILPLLRRADGSRGIKSLVGLLLGNGLIARLLSEGALSVEESIDVAQIALEIDPAFDVALARQAAENAGTAGPEVTEQVLDVLAAISKGSRILPSLTLLLRHPSAPVRLKAALLVGWSTGRPRWVEKVLTETDPRLRANAIEAIDRYGTRHRTPATRFWGADKTGVRVVLEAAAGDCNNRVAGNALLALYRLGESSACPAIARMAHHTDSAHRATAAWLMGEIEDPRYSAILARLMADGDGVVRRRAHLSIKRLREVSARSRKLDGASLVVGPPLAEGDVWKVPISFGPGGDSLDPKPAQFAPYESGQPIFDYQVETLAVAEALALGVLVPGAPASQAAVWLDGLRECLKSKRAADLWTVLRYGEAAAECVDTSPAAPRYSSDDRALAESLLAAQTDALPDFVRNTARTVRQKIPRGLVPGFWTAVRRCAGCGCGLTNTARHMLVLNMCEREAPPDCDLMVSSALKHRLRIHAVSTVAAPVLESLAERTGGIYRGPIAETDAAEAVRSVYCLMLPRFALRWRRQFPDQPLRVQLHCRQGWLEGESLAQPRK